MQLRVVGQFLEQLAAKFVLSRTRGFTHNNITLFVGTLSDHRERQSRVPKFETRTPSYESSFLIQFYTLVKIYTFP